MEAIEGREKEKEQRVIEGSILCLSFGDCLCLVKKVLEGFRIEEHKGRSSLKIREVS